MQNDEQGFSFKSLFVPFTSFKAVQWIIVIGLVVYFNSLFNGFVGDDGGQITENPLVQSIDNIPGFFSGSTFYGGSSQRLGGIYYKPLLTTVFSLIYNLFGSNATAFHFFQIILYILSACILFLFLKRLIAKETAFLMTLIFLLHPINSEAAFYISATQDSLFFFFGISALLLLTFVKSIKYLILITFLLFLSILSKETGILFVVVACLYTYLYSKKRIYPFFGLLLVMIAIYLLLRISAIGILSTSGISPIDRLTLPFRLLNIPAMILFYLKQFFFPFNLSISYQWAYTHANLMNLILPLTIDSFFVCMLTVFAVILYRNYPRKYFQIYIFFAIWFCMGIIFHLQLIPLDATVAERWFYFPIVGLLGMLGVLLNVFHFNIKNKWSVIFISIILLLLSARTFIRSFDLKDNFTLYTHDAHVSENDYVLEKGIGMILSQQGKLEEAKIHIEKSIATNPYSINYDALGLIYEQMGDYPKAKKAFLTGLKFSDFYIIYENLAGLSVVSGNPNENIKFIKYALSKFPKDARLWLYLAVVEYKINNTEEAKLAINQAYSYDQSPEISNIYNIIINNQPLNLKLTTSKPS